MPPTVTATVTLSTPYGPAAYTVHLTGQGEVTGVESAAARLPEPVFQLTYGKRWEEARAYFQHLAALLPFQAEAAVMLTDPPREFKALRKLFRGIEINENDAPHHRLTRLWRANPAFTPALFLQKKLARALVTIYETLVAAGDPAPYRPLEPLLFTLMPFVIDVSERETLYHNLALMRTAATREYLFSELERPGRHIYATVLLHSLRHFKTESDLIRLLELYPWIKDDGLIIDYTALLSHFPDPRVHERLGLIINEFPDKVSYILKDLKKAKHPTPYTLIRKRFEQEKNEQIVDQLVNLTQKAPDPELRVSLTEMNAKMASPAFIELPPVSWPQSLGTYWTRLVTVAPAEEVLNEVNKYLSRPEPRLQRNALLLLKDWAKAQHSPPALPPAIEDRLRELINARHDKIFTIALDIAAVVMPTLEQPAAMVDILLEHSLISRYRLMNAAALKKAAEKPELREQQIDFFRQSINTAADISELETIIRIIPYVNFLGVRAELENLAAERKKRM